MRDPRQLVGSRPSRWAVASIGEATRCNRLRRQDERRCCLRGWTHRTSCSGHRVRSLRWTARLTGRAQLNEGGRRRRRPKLGAFRRLARRQDDCGPTTRTNAHHEGFHLDNFPQPIPDQTDTFVAIVQWLGVPALMIVIIVQIWRISDWIRFGRGTYLLSRRALLRVQAMRGRGPNRNPNINWARRAQVTDTIRAPALQILAVFALYAAARLPLSWGPVFVDLETGWQRLPSLTASLPTEDPPWTGWIAAGLIGLLAAYDLALLSRATIPAKVAGYLLNVAAMVCRFAAILLAGASGIGIVFVLLASLGSAFSGSYAIFSLSWLALTLTAVVLYISTMLILSVVLITPRVLYPQFKPPSLD
jgi:hypothetical protein